MHSPLFPILVVYNWAANFYAQLGMGRSSEGIRISGACYTPCCLSSVELYEVGEGEEEGPIASPSSSSSAPILLWVLKLKLDLLLLLPPPRPPIAPNLQQSHRFPYICEDKLSAREMEMLSISHNEISLSVSSRNSCERSGGHPYSPPMQVPPPPTTKGRRSLWK